MEVFLSMSEFVSKNKHVNIVGKSNADFEQMGLIMTHEGQMDQSVIRVIANAVEKKMNEEKEELRLQKLIFHIVVEFLQNISKYTDDDEKGKGILIVGKTKENYYVSAGNIVYSVKIPVLSSSIEKVNNLNTVDLKQLYDTKIANYQFNEQGGAGLGWIDVVKKSKQKLHYHFESLKDGKSFFLITATVALKQQQQ